MNNKFSCFIQSCCRLICSCFRVFVFKVNSFWVHLCYFLTFSLVGYLALRFSKPRTASFRPENFDLYFTSVSSLTNSSMSTVEMEVFSNFQLIVMIILMTIGGEVFMSWVELYIRSKLPRKQTIGNGSSLDQNLDHGFLNKTNSLNQAELGLVSFSSTQTENSIPVSSGNNSMSLRDNSIKYLCHVVFGYLLAVHLGGISLVVLYISLIPSAEKVLESKGLQILIFSIFTIVSTFTNCGFVPTNENMIVFKKNPGLLLVLIPQILLGNTLYPVSLRFVIWVLKKITKRVEFEYILRNYKEIGYPLLFSGIHSSFLCVTVFGFIFLQFAVFCSLEWNSEATVGLNFYHKLVASLFQVANSRYAGESVFDLSILSSAVLALFVVMMYLPPYTSFLPTRYRERTSRNFELKENEKKSFMECLIFSQLSYLVIAIIMICITEREKLKDDPLNFNVLNITVEVISAYGNVGLSTGYSCKRQLTRDKSCKDSWYGFVGRWSTGGKLVLILVMFLGRLKKFNMKGGKAWKLS